ncbi:hypothetical protein [Mucilaginibacter sp. L3T2-6]|uniref:hypothetical protein n=1 Tax=Mucilaginibacter sp. L3T2-6 TaxID=3062491 RepID=UPI00267679F2|nr:hypothetical protein [Mucilaginibacter sp. L3T2-6]MDO3641292.1 hypothetical protein [Mucilaginibacter sp. L3T2-6]MDV6213948.1 hypothetical protein [Mucilaginibacter sp. L3T2-6]
MTANLKTGNFKVGLPSPLNDRLHFFLSKAWQNRVKDRDWFDLEWYIRKGVPPDLDHFRLRAKDTGDWTGETRSKEQVLKLLRDKINGVNFRSVKDDVVRFIADDSALEIWGPQYFLDLAEKLKFSS